jgi:acetolactate synthase regulatory subunit
MVRPSDPEPIPMSEHLEEPLVAARFTVIADGSPGLLSRVLEPFAKRDLILDTLRATREGDAMRAEIALHAMPLGMVHLVAGNLGQIVGVRRVEAMEGRVVRLAA